MPPRVAFLGLGRMGQGMAGRYLDAGFDLTVWNRSEAKARDLITRGARWATSPAVAANDADAIVTMVADDDASREVWLGDDGAAQAAKRGALAIECSTVSHRHAVALARELQSLGLTYVDCPVTGLPDAAATGKLALLVGADAADLERARPYLAPLATNIRHFGAIGNGTIFKLINNLLGAVQIASLAEGMAIAEQAGLDAPAVADALSNGAVASPQVIRHSRRMAARDFSNPTFTAALRHKDVRYAIELARTLLPDVPIGRATLATYEAATAHAPDDDEARLIEIVSRER